MLIWLVDLLPIFALGQRRLQEVMRCAIRCTIRYVMGCTIVGGRRQLFVLPFHRFFTLLRDLQNSKLPQPRIDSMLKI